MARAQGILTDIGSPAGHMAAVAREFRLPTIVGCGVATQLLHTGDEITVDATQNVVYRGLVKELRYFELTEETVYEDSYEYRLLRRVLKKITPLQLVDSHDRAAVAGLAQPKGQAGTRKFRCAKGQVSYIPHPVGQQRAGPGPAGQD